MLKVAENKHGLMCLLHKMPSVVVLCAGDLLLHWELACKPWPFWWDSSWRGTLTEKNNNTDMSKPGSRIKNHNSSAFCRDCTHWLQAIEVGSAILQQSESGQVEVLNELKTRPHWTSGTRNSGNSQSPAKLYIWMTWSHTLTWSLLPSWPSNVRKTELLGWMSKSHGPSFPCVSPGLLALMRAWTQNFAGNPKLEPKVLTKVVTMAVWRRFGEEAGRSQSMHCAKPH